MILTSWLVWPCYALGVRRRKLKPLLERNPLRDGASGSLVTDP
jgi:hypothetical protein